MYAILKGMGFAGAHISGHGMTVDDLEYVIDQGEELLPNWPELVHEFDFPQPNGWYYFEADKKTGLNTETPAARNERHQSGLRLSAIQNVSPYDVRSARISIPAHGLALKGSGSIPSRGRLYQGRANHQGHHQRLPALRRLRDA